MFLFCVFPGEGQEFKREGEPLITQMFCRKPDREGNSCSRLPQTPGLPRAALPWRPCLPGPPCASLFCLPPVLTPVLIFPTREAGGSGQHLCVARGRPRQNFQNGPSATVILPTTAPVASKPGPTPGLTSAVGRVGRGLSCCRGDAWRGAGAQGEAPAGRSR